MPIGFAIFLTLIASTLMNAGIVLLKKWVVGLPSASLHRPHKILANLIQTKLGCFGLLLQLSGYFLFLAAVSARSAPISVLQPLCAFGLVVIALLAVVYLKERFARMEWLGVALLLAGVVLLGISIETTPPPLATLHFSRWLLVAAGLGALACLFMYLLASLENAASAEVLFGLLAGILLGLGYLGTKGVSLAWLEGSPEGVVLSLAAMAIGSPGGLIVLLLSFRHGRALLVTAVNFVINQVIVIAGGWFCLGESFPDAALPLAARLGGLGTILVGIMVLFLFRRRPTHYKIIHAQPVLAVSPPQPDGLDVPGP